MEKNNQTKSVFTISGRHRFVACVILVILVSSATFAYLSCCYKQAQNDIVALQRKDAWVFGQVLNGSKNVKSKSSDNIDQLQALLDKHQERQEALLHLEYNKLQADFNVLMFAASCLMIISWCSRYILSSRPMKCSIRLKLRQKAFISYWMRQNRLLRL